MLLGEVIILAWFGGLLLIGFTLVYAALSLLAWTGRTLMRLFTGGSPRGGPLQRAIACPYPRCEHLNRPGARFCARCGRPFASPFPDVDAYG